MSAMPCAIGSLDPRVADGVSVVGAPSGAVGRRVTPSPVISSDRVTHVTPMSVQGSVPSAAGREGGSAGVSGGRAVADGSFDSAGDAAGSGGTSLGSSSSTSSSSERPDRKEKGS